MGILPTGTGLFFCLIFLALYFYEALSHEDGIFLELLSIVGTVALWEAVSSFLLERTEINIEMMNIRQHLNQQVEFVFDAPD